MEMQIFISVLLAIIVGLSLSTAVLARKHKRLTITAMKLAKELSRVTA